MYLDQSSTTLPPPTFTIPSNATAELPIMVFYILYITLSHTNQMRHERGQVEYRTVVESSVLGTTRNQGWNGGYTIPNYIILGKLLYL